MDKLTFAYHKLIRALIIEIKHLRIDNQSLRNENESISWSAYHAEERASRAHRQAEYAAEKARRVQDETNYREDRRQDLMKDLERARSWGNDWEEQRILDKMKRI